LRAAAGRYVDFRTVTEESLAYAAKAARIVLPSDARRTLMDAHERLEPWPDAQDALLSMKKAGLRLAPLTNYSPSMLENVLTHAGSGRSSTGSSPPTAPRRSSPIRGPMPWA
jgi:2-haloacid dehalogenase